VQKTIDDISTVKRKERKGLFRFGELAVSVRALV
jgi:hypothetical protein